MEEVKSKHLICRTESEIMYFTSAHYIYNVTIYTDSNNLLEFFFKCSR